MTKLISHFCTVLAIQYLFIMGVPVLDSYRKFTALLPSTSVPGADSGEAFTSSLQVYEVEAVSGLTLVVN